MINILLVDDETEISEVLNDIIVRYFSKNGCDDYLIDTATNGFEALGMMQKTQYNILFLDFMMPKCNGIEVLDTTRIINKDKHQPYICMVTAMGLNKNIALFKEKKASSYAIKPFDTKTIHLMLDRYIKPLIENVEQEEDEFFDFYDFDEDEPDNENENKEYMDKLNKSHGHVSATEFLKNYDDISYMLDELDEINELFDEICEFLDKDNFEENKEDIGIVFNLYARFLRGLSDFEELATILIDIKNIILELDLTLIPEKKAIIIIEMIRVLLKDLSDWKEHVFVQKDTIDVFYINASSYNSYIQLKDLIEK